MESMRQLHKILHLDSTVLENSIISKLDFINSCINSTGIVNTYGRYTWRNELKKDVLRM